MGLAAAWSDAAPRSLNREFLAMAKDAGLIDLNLNATSILNLFVYVQDDGSVLDADVCIALPRLALVLASGLG
jgi:hypothetical protein